MSTRISVKSVALYMGIVASWLYLISEFGIKESMDYLLNMGQYPVLEGTIVEINQLRGVYKGKIFMCSICCVDDTKQYRLPCRLKDYIGENVCIYLDRQRTAHWCKPYIPKNTAVPGVVIFAFAGELVIIMDICSARRKKLIRAQVLYKVKKHRGDHYIEYAVCIWRDEKEKDHLFKTYISRYPIEYEVKDEVYFLVDPWNYHNYEIVMNDELDSLLLNKQV